MVNEWDITDSTLYTCERKHKRKCYLLTHSHDGVNKVVYEIWNDGKSNVFQSFKRYTWDNRLGYIFTPITGFKFPSRYVYSTLIDLNFSNHPINLVIVTLVDAMSTRFSMLTPLIDVDLMCKAEKDSGTLVSVPNLILRWYTVVSYTSNRVIF